MSALPPGRPGLLFGGFAPAAFKRMAAAGEGWVAPSFGFEPLVEGIAARRAWSGAGRSGRPRIVVARYFSLGERAGQTADHYLAHYYGEQYLNAVRADTSTTPRQLEAELHRLFDAGCDDVVLLPCSDELEQPAPDALAPYVTCLWEHRIGGGDLAYDQPVLPDGCIDLVAVDGTLSRPVRRLAR